MIRDFYEGKLLSECAINKTDDDDDEFILRYVTAYATIPWETYASRN